MRSRLEQYEHLLKLYTCPGSGLIEDSKYHVLTDASPSKKSKYCVFKNRTFDVYSILKANFTDFDWSSRGAA